MTALRQLSARPGLIVSENAAVTKEPTTNKLVGMPGPWGRDRVLFSIPMTWVDIQAQVLVRDEGSFHLADVDGNVIGQPRISIQRMLGTRRVTDTRRLG